MFRPTAIDSALDGRVSLRTDMARITSGRYVAIQVDAGARRREFVVATQDETARGWIPKDGRRRFAGIHDAYDAAHHLAARERRFEAAA